MKRFLLALALLFTNFAFATLPLQPGCYGIQGEFLYLHPSLNDTDFAIQENVATGVPSGTRFNNSFNLKPAFRLTGAYSFCNPGNEIYIQWTHFNGSNSRTVLGTFNTTDAYPPIGTMLQAQEASSNINIAFNSVDCFYQKSILFCCPLELSIRFGLQYARIKITESIKYRNTNLSALEEVVSKERNWGVGPQLGFAADFSLSRLNCFQNVLCQGDLSLTFLAWGSLLGSTINNRYNVTSNFGPPVNSDNDSLWGITPAMHARLGINYSNCLSCFCFNTLWSLEVGYEFTTFRDAIYKQVFTESLFAGESFNHFSSFDLQGPYLAASLCF